jgi:hypothetical protein
MASWRIPFCEFPPEEDEKALLPFCRQEAKSTSEESAVYSKKIPKIFHLSHRTTNSFVWEGWFVSE